MATSYPTPAILSPPPNYLPSAALRPPQPSSFPSLHPLIQTLKVKALAGKSQADHALSNTSWLKKSRRSDLKLIVGRFVSLRRSIERVIKWVEIEEPVGDIERLYSRSLTACHTVLDGIERVLRMLDGELLTYNKISSVKYVIEAMVFDFEMSVGG
jgi:hypothetical protein